MATKRLRIFTWHIHGSYLYFLSQGNYDIFIPVNDQRNEGYYGRGHTFPFGNNVIEVPSVEVRNMEFDCILFQTNKNYLADQYEVLSEAQRNLPKVYVEHDPPVQHPTDARHIIHDNAVTMVHVTHFNKLMWDNGTNNARVIEHGVEDKGYLYKGTLDKGIVIVNHLHQRGRKLGSDIYEYVSKRVPLDLVGMGTTAYGGLGEVLHPQLPAFTAQYRFFFNPIRYTSLGLAVCEAMTLGIPVVALQTTEHANAIKNGVTGYVHTDVDYLIEKMQELIENPVLAHSLGMQGRNYALERFNIQRFTRAWESTFHYSINQVYEKTNSIY